MGMMRNIDTDGLLDKCACGAIPVFVANLRGVRVECLDNCGNQTGTLRNTSEAMEAWDKLIRAMKAGNRVACELECTEHTRKHREGCQYCQANSGWGDPRRRDPAMEHQEAGRVAAAIMETRR